MLNHETHPIIKLALLCALAVILETGALAQNSTPPKIPFQVVSEPASLPYLPSVAPPGGKLVFALKRGKAQNGRVTVVLRYTSSEDGAGIIRYYAEMLPKSKWTITAQSTQRIAASYKNYTLSAMVYRPSTPQSRGDVQLTYQMPLDE